MIIQLKEKHLCYALHLIQSETVGAYLAPATAVSDAIRDNDDGEDAMLSVDVSAEVVYNIWTKAGQLAQIFAQAINQDIKAVLVPQLIALGTEESLGLLSRLQSLTESYEAMLNQNIEEARVKVKPPVLPEN